MTTYIADLDPEHRASFRSSVETLIARWDELMPGWETLEQDPEKRSLVLENDVR